MKRLMRLAASKISDAAQTQTIDARRCAAAGTEIPIPVASAMYAATHMGHLGSRASAVVGKIQPTLSPTRRQRDVDHRAVPCSVVAVWQRQ